MRISNVLLLKTFADKTVIVTGANSGIGFETALALAKRKARIILADNKDLTESKKKIIESSGNTKIVAKYLDFTSLNSVRCFARQINQSEKNLDVLLNNAGVFCLGKERTVDGLQSTMQVNHFGPFLLTCLLSGLLKKCAPSRVIFVSSLGAFFHKFTLDRLNQTEIAPVDGLNSIFTYYNSKLCSMVSARMFAEKFAETGVTCNCLHPGMASSEFLLKRHSPFYPFLKLFTQDVESAAQQSIFLATSDNVEGISGKFYVNFREHEWPRIMDDEEFCQSLWDATEMFVGLTASEKAEIEE